jgi:hypothetical protein
MAEFFTKLLIGITLQFVLFIPLFLVWKNDCKEIGKENLAVSLEERFFTWIFVCPCWLVIFLR